MVTVSALTELHDASYFLLANPFKIRILNQSLRADYLLRIAANDNNGRPGCYQSYFLADCNKVSVDTRIRVPVSQFLNGENFSEHS